MCLRSILVLVIYLIPVRTVPMNIYNNAWFHPTSVSYQLISLPSVSTLNMCACQCFNYSLCVTGTYFGNNQTCILFSAYLSQGQLQPASNALTNVFSFSNRTIEIDLPKTPAIIEWLFDGNFNDVYGRYNGYLSYSNGTLINNSASLWISPGYAGYGSAVNFPSNMYSVVNQYLDLTTTSFTISAWIWTPTNFTFSVHDYFILLSQCEEAGNNKCLHIAVAYGNLYLGFYNDDLRGNSSLYAKQWYHVAYVYDPSPLQQLVYLNGILDGSRIPNAPFTGNASQIVLGAAPLINSISFHSGLIENLIFVSYVKNTSELLDEATLVAYYSFDGSYIDLGPNNINNITTVLTTFDLNGRFNQALRINSQNLSYFQTTGFYYLGQTNYNYSFSLWIYPFINNGTILQVSSSNGWCVPMIGFNSGGQLVVQTLSIHGIYSASLTNGTLSLNQWTYISMTYSTANGIRLFVNGSLVSGNVTFNDYSASGNMSTITIGTCLQPNACAANETAIVLSQFRGAIDELKIFSRELSRSEVYELMVVP